MDPITHTLTGAALGEAGLKERTALGMATLVIGANLPDVDVLSYAWGDVTALGFRRGWTHGALAMVVLPLALAGGMVLWDRLLRRRRRTTVEPAKPGPLLVLAAASVWSHPVLDFLNTYGMRFLMPFSGRWSYGDALFIIDPWVWLVLTAGILVARRKRGEASPQHAHRPARAALGLVSVYVAVMLLGNVAVRRIIAWELRDAGLAPAARLMVSPLPVNPFRRLVILDVGERYEFASFRWLPAPRLSLDGYHVVKRPNPHPAAAAAMKTPEGRSFLHWARFPFYRVERAGEATLVHIGDARYTLDPEESWAAVTVRVPASP